MDNDHGYQNTEKMEVDDTPLFPIQRPDGYYEGWFSKHSDTLSPGSHGGLSV